MGSFTVWKSAAAACAEIRNVFCVGRNYRDHAVELGNDVPTKPMIFLKSTHALTPAAGTVQLPAGRQEIHHELEIVLYITQPVTALSKAQDVVGAVALGLDLTDRAAQSELKAKGHPWEYAKSFVNSAVLTDFYAFTDFQAVQDAEFSLDINGRTVQQGKPVDMIFDFDQLIYYAHEHFGLAVGDILFSGTPAGVGALAKGDECVLRLCENTWGKCRIG